MRYTITLEVDKQYDQWTYRHSSTDDPHNGYGHPCAALGRSMAAVIHNSNFRSPFDVIAEAVDALHGYYGRPAMDGTMQAMIDACRAVARSREHRDAMELL